MVVIDAGHGGSDPGAVANNIIEKNYNLLISNYIYERLSELGIPVARTRDSDITLTPTERVNIIRTYANSPSDIVISNHLNAGGGDGAEVIYALRNSSEFANVILEELRAAGQNIRKAYQRRLPENTELDYYFIIRDTAPMQTVLIEYGFVDSPYDDLVLIKSRWADLAEAAVRAVARYLNYPYSPPIAEEVYIVQPGDTLYSIARRFGLTVADLKRINNLVSDTLQIGQILALKETEVLPPPTLEPEEGFIIHTVTKGDTLYSLARIYSTTVEEIKAINNLTSNILQIGQELKIPVITTVPEEPVIPEEPIPPEIPTIPPIGEYDQYVVRAGDTLYSIARRYNTDVQTIMMLNNLTSDLLSIGTILIVPRPSDFTTEPPPPTESFIQYVVKSGDNLYSIANRFNTTVDAIKRKNNLITNLLSIGQILEIPISGEMITYIVESGDNLWDIARAYNTTVEEIKRINNLKSNALQIGQTLLIPR